VNSEAQKLLKGIYEPFSGTDLASSGLVSEAVVEGRRVRIRLRLRSAPGCPACPTDRVLGGFFLEALKDRIVRRLRRQGFEDIVLELEE